MTGKTKINQDQTIVEAIRAGNTAVLKDLYPRYRDDFIQWVNARFYCSEEDLLDIYQEAIIVFYQNVVEGKIAQLSCSIRTYLFSVGKHLLYKKFKEKTNKPTDELDIKQIRELDWHLLEKEELNHREQIMKMAFQRLGKVCRTLLNYFYYYEFGLEVIKERMEYKNTDTVKSQKRRCMQNLEQILKTEFKEEL